MVVQWPDELMKFLNVSDFEPVKPLRSYLQSIREHSMHCMAFECTWRHPANVQSLGLMTRSVKVSPDT